MRRSLTLFALFIALSAPFAAALAAQPAGPVVDVVEIAGIIDRPIARYAIERIDKAESERDSLLVFEINSLGGMKISDADPLPLLVRRIRDASIPIAVHVGPRRARAAGVAVYMAQAATISSVGPSVTVGPGWPLDLANVRPQQQAADAFVALARARSRTVSPAGKDILSASEAVTHGFADVEVPSVAELLRRIDGKTVTTAAGSVKLSLPEKQTVVRFFQPGPIRRLLHAFANPALVYLCLIGAAMLIVFELFQPGFGVAGVAGALLLTGGVYGLTVLPVRPHGIIALVLGLVLLTVDVARDAIALPTLAGTAGLIAGSMVLLPGGSDAVRLSPWLVGFSVAACLIFFVPAMTVVRRARKPMGTEVKAALVGEFGEVRSVLNPEGFVFVTEELWRARSEDGRRMRVGEPVVVASIDAGVLIVRAPGGENGSSPSPN